MTKGFSQKYEIDYLETFVSMVKMNTDRVILAIVVIRRWRLDQLDVKNTFLNGDLEEKVYICLPHNYDKSRKYCKLRKALCSLKQSPRAWFDRLRTVMRSTNYLQGNSDHALFVRCVDRKVSIFVVYVDDMIVTGDHKGDIVKLKKCLADKFDLKDLSKLRYFLGVEFTKSNEGLVICQRKYTLDLLKETRKFGSRPVSIPVNLVSQFMYASTDKHIQAAERILSYLKKNPGKDLLFAKSNDLRIKGYSDADWARSVNIQRSTTRYCVFLIGNLVIWRNKR